VSQALYFVVEKNGRWYVQHSGAEYPYVSRAIAVSAAIGAANSSGLRGYVAKVFEPCAQAEWRPIWVFGQDPYPPRG
jgi:hypothetical protein